MSEGAILVTGGLGFIGAALTRRLLRETQARVVVFDAETYAATPEALEEAAQSPRYRFVHGDVRDLGALRAAIAEHRPRAILHLAAESHVDRSIDEPGVFMQTNVLGAMNVLQAARGHFETLTSAARDAFRIVHVSTDEVFGALAEDAPPFDETAPYAPRSPYAASKAASDHLARAWAETFGVPVVITNCSNNYGPWQFPEKLIPVMIMKARDGEPLPVYGQGRNIRDWLHVEDHAAALHLALDRGRPGETYLIGARNERRNLAVVEAICAAMDARFPDRAPHTRLMRFVPDRPGHDLRYAINPAKTERELGWRPTVGFEAGLAATVDWFLAHEPWWRGLIAKGLAGGRLGLGRAPAQTGSPPGG